jgi:hypothetical protein
MLEGSASVLRQAHPEQVFRAEKYYYSEHEVRHREGE